HYSSLPLIHLYFSTIRPPPRSTLFPYTTLFRSNATASAPGTFAYSPAAGTVLPAGASQTLSVTFTPTDLTRYATAAATVSIAVAKATPALSWSAPADITYGTPLGGTQLSATSSVPGAFAYSPPAGTILGAGAGQRLSAAFTPTDAANYAAAATAVPI